MTEAHEEWCWGARGWACTCLCWCGGETRRDEDGLWCLADIHHDPLPGVQREVERLLAALRDTYDEEGVRLYLRSAADKAEALAGGPPLRLPDGVCPYCSVSLESFCPTHANGDGGAR